MEFLPLNDEFLKYAWNTHNKKGKLNQRIDYTILAGLYKIFNVHDPDQLIEKLNDYIIKC